MKKKIYILFIVNLVIFLFVDLSLLKSDKYYYLKYNPIDCISGIFIGYTIFLLNKCILKLLTYSKKSTDVKKKSYLF
jgi:hypothetical protein